MIKTRYKIGDMVDVYIKYEVQRVVSDCEILVIGKNMLNIRPPKGLPLDTTIYREGGTHNTYLSDIMGMTIPKTHFEEGLFQV